MTESLRLPKTGDRIIYTLTEGDAQSITSNRDASEGLCRGNTPRAGDEVPGFVVRTFDPNATYANLQVFMDGNDSYWPTSVPQGDGDGKFRFAA